MVWRQAWQVTVDEGSTVDLQHVPVLHHLLNARSFLQIHAHTIVVQDDVLHPNSFCNPEGLAHNPGWVHFKIIIWCLLDCLLSTSYTRQGNVGSKTDCMYIYFFVASR